MTSKRCKAAIVLNGTISGFFCWDKDIMPKDYEHISDRKKEESSKPVNEESTISLVAKFVIDEWDKYNDYWSSRLGDFERYYDQWRGKQYERDEPWQSQFHKRLTWKAEKTLVPEYHSALFPIPAPIATDVPEIENDFTAILSKSIVSHWFKIGNFSDESLNIIRDSAVYGTGLYEDDWFIKLDYVPSKEEVEEEDRRKMVDSEGNAVLNAEGNIMTEVIGTKKVKKEVNKLKIIEDRYRLRKVNIFSWRVHPNKLDDDDGLPAIKQEFITYNDLIRRQSESEKIGFKGFDNIEKLKDSTNQIGEEDLRRYKKHGVYLDQDNPQIELLHYWGKYGDDDKPKWIIVANRKWVLKDILNPYWHRKAPLGHIVWTKDIKDSYYGIGLAEIGKDSEDRASKNVQYREDVKKKNVKGTGWYNATDKKIKRKDLTRNPPGYMRSCSDVNNAFKYDNPVSLGIDDYKEEETAVNDHREITGAVTSLQATGDEKGQHKTLGGIQLLMSRALKRLKPDLATIEKMLIKRVANRGLLLTRQFQSRNEIIELKASKDKIKALGIGQLYDMSPQDILKKVEFHSIGLMESLEKAQNIDRLLQFMEMTSKLEPLQAMTNYPNILKRLALWMGFDDVDDLVNMNPMQPFEESGIPEGGIPPQALPPNPLAMMQAGGIPPQGGQLPL